MSKYIDKIILFQRCRKIIILKVYFDSDYFLHNINLNAIFFLRINKHLECLNILIWYGERKWLLVKSADVHAMIPGATVTQENILFMLWFYLVFIMALYHILKSMKKMYSFFNVLQSDYGLSSSLLWDKTKWSKGSMIFFPYLYLYQFKQGVPEL